MDPLSWGTTSVAGSRTGRNNARPTSNASASSSRRPVGRFAWATPHFSRCSSLQKKVIDGQHEVATTVAGKIVPNDNIIRLRVAQRRALLRRRPDVESWKKLLEDARRAHVG